MNINTLDIIREYFKKENFTGHSIIYGIVHILSFPIILFLSILNDILVIIDNIRNR